MAEAVYVRDNELRSAIEKAFAGEIEEGLTAIRVMEAAKRARPDMEEEADRNIAKARSEVRTTYDLAWRIFGISEEKIDPIIIESWMEDFARAEEEELRDRAREAIASLRNA